MIFRGLGNSSMHVIRGQRRSIGSPEQNGKPSRATVRRLLGLLRPHRARLALALGLTVLGIMLGLVPPLLMRQVIDVAIAHRDAPMLLWLAGGMVLFPAAGAMVSVGLSYLNTVVAQGIIHDLRVAMYEHGQKLGVDFFTQTPGGEIHSRLVNDLNAVQQVLGTFLISFVVNAMTIVLTLALMFTLNSQLSLISIVMLPAYALPVLRFGRRTYAAITRTQENLSRLTAHLEETLTLSGILVVKSFGTRRREAERFRSISEEVQQSQVAQSMVGRWFGFVYSAISAVGPALLYGYGGYLVISDQVQIGTIVAFVAYLAKLYSPASSLAGSNTTLLGGLALFDRIFGFLDQPIGVPEPQVPATILATDGVTPVGLGFYGVWFGYRADEEVLHGIDFEAPAGQLTAIVGPSGAGKSTILSLAARFYDPDEGQVFLSGRPVTAICEDDLRRLVSVVTQEPFLLHRTLEDNIRYGRPEATPADVARAVAAAQMQEFVERLPDGLATVVGERGYRLSGGEKQRVAIARAILRNPSLLLLDEATSSLDSHAERLIQQALADLFRGRTVIAIAHRLSTILAADQILVVDQGRIVERGSHQSLLAACGPYAHLYHEQFDPGITARGYG